MINVSVSAWKCIVLIFLRKNVLSKVKLTGNAFVCLKDRKCFYFLV